MILHLHGHQITDKTERYKDIGLSLEFLSDIKIVCDTLEKAGYEPYDQLTGYVRTGKDCYITRRNNARSLVLGMDVKDIKVFLKHYGELK